MDTRTTDPSDESTDRQPTTDPADESNTGEASATDPPDGENSRPATDSKIDEKVIVKGGEFKDATLGNKTKNIAGDSYEEPVRNVIQGSDLAGAMLGEQTTNIHHHYADNKDSQISPRKGEFLIKPTIVVYETNEINAESRILRGELLSDIAGNQEIALKMLSDDENSRKEASLHFNIPPHPNIVHPIFSNTYKYLGQHCIYIALELCDPLNLYNYTKQLKREQCPFPAQLFLSYVQQITDGVAFLHFHRIINRDLKPQNVLLTVDKTVAKLCDFGLCKPIKGDVTELSKAQAGTSGWMSPEVLRGDKHISTSADIFSLALIHYFLLSYGEHAFGNIPLSRDHYILHNQNLCMENFKILNPDPISKLINQMLNPDPTLRPSAEQVKTEIKKIFSPIVHTVNEEGIIESDEALLQASRNYMKKDLESAQAQRSHAVGTEQKKATGYLRDDELSDTAGVEQRDITKARSDDSKIWGETDRLIKESKFEEAIELIKNFSPTQHQQLVMSECYLQLGKMKKAEKCINTLEYVMSIAHNLSLGDVDKLITEYISTESYIRALILGSCLSKLCSSDLHLDNSVEAICVCLIKCCSIIHEMIQRKGRLSFIATNFGLEMINDQLRSLTDVDSDLKAELGARCFYRFSMCYVASENFRTSLELLQKGIDIMQNQLGVNSSKFTLFGELLYSSGTAHGNMGNYSEAHSFYIRALDVFQIAEECPGDASREENINKVKNSLIRIEKILE